MKTNKIKNLVDLREIVKTLHLNGKKIVFTNGCFDILHIGHVDYLRKSKALGDILIVGLNSDDSVKRLKGETRPINNLASRAAVLEALVMVDYVVAFEEDTPYEVIKALKPDVYTKGGDYNMNNVIGPGLGSDIIEQYGGKVELIPCIEGVSTTNILTKHRAVIN